MSRFQVTCFVSTFICDDKYDQGHMSFIVCRELQNKIYCCYVGQRGWLAANLEVLRIAY